MVPDGTQPERLPALRYPGQHCLPPDWLAREEATVDKLLCRLRQDQRVVFLQRLHKDLDGIYDGLLEGKWMTERRCEESYQWLRAMVWAKMCILEDYPRWVPGDLVSA